MIEWISSFKEVTVVFPVDDLQVGTMQALLVTPSLAVVYADGKAFIDKVEPSQFFGGKYYEFVTDPAWTIEEITYENESELLEVANELALRIAEEEPEMVKVTVKCKYEGRMDEETMEGILLPSGKVFVANWEGCGLYQATETAEPGVVLIDLDENGTDYMANNPTVILDELIGA